MGSIRTADARELIVLFGMRPDFGSLRRFDTALLNGAADVAGGAVTEPTFFRDSAEGAAEKAPYC